MTDTTKGEPMEIVDRGEEIMSSTQSVGGPKRSTSIKQLTHLQKAREVKRLKKVEKGTEDMALVLQSLDELHGEIRGLKRFPYSDLETTTSILPPPKKQKTTNGPKQLLSDGDMAAARGVLGVPTYIAAGVAFVSAALIGGIKYHKFFKTAEQDIYTI